MPFFSYFNSPTGTCRTIRVKEKITRGFAHNTPSVTYFMPVTTGPWAVWWLLGRVFENFSQKCEGFGHGVGVGDPIGGRSFARPHFYPHVSWRSGPGICVIKDGERVLIGDVISHKKYGGIGQGVAQLRDRVALGGAQDPNFDNRFTLQHDNAIQLHRTGEGLIGGAGRDLGARGAGVQRRGCGLVFNPHALRSRGALGARPAWAGSLSTHSPSCRAAISVLSARTRFSNSSWSCVSASSSASHPLGPITPMSAPWEPMRWAPSGG